MSSTRFALTLHLVLFLLVCADSANSQVHYYITPSLSVHCPGDPCLTLAEFAANSTRYLGNEMNISLFFLPGNHSFDGELSLSHADYLLMTTVIGGNGNVFVKCGGQSGRFDISETTFTMIKNLHFYGCGGNRVSRAEQFIVEDAIFEGMEGRGTALTLNEVTDAHIENSSFLSNIHASTFEHHDISAFDNQDLLNYLLNYLNRDPSIAVGGALYSAFSNISIFSCKFTDNTAEIGGALLAHNSNLHIVGSTYSHNKASFGGALATSEASINIKNSNFTENAAMIYGGVTIAYNNSLSISNVTFSFNRARSNGGVIMAYESFVNVTDSTFSDNTAAYHGVEGSGGVISTSGSSFIITSSNFTNNYANYVGGVMFTNDDLPFIITSSTFSNNSANISGGVMYTYRSSFNITGSTFINSSAAIGGGGVMHTSNSSLKITSSNFTNNSANRGGVMFTPVSSYNIISSVFTNNSANRGGVMYTYFYSSFNIITSTFTTNSADDIGGVAYAGISSFIICIGSHFHANKANSFGGIMFTIESFTHVTNGTFGYNSGSLYIFNSNLTFSGYTRFENCAEPSGKPAGEREEGGAVTSVQSTVIFTGVSNLSSNKARRGGAILAAESTILMYGETIIENNTATDSSGGGISLHQSYLEVRGNSIISGNVADMGGGIHATSSIVAVYQPWTLRFTNNRAKDGSGLYLEVNAKLYVLKHEPSDTRSENLLLFQANHANYGGAIYVADNTNAGACSSDSECFIQTLGFYQDIYTTNAYALINIHFSGNTASEQGANIFGGLLDRCIPSPYAEVYGILETPPPRYSGVSYLSNITNIRASGTISSLPIRVCFCKRENESEPDCSYQPPTFKVKKGGALTVPLVAVDQVNHSVAANIISSLSSQDGGFSEGQQAQSAGRYCSNVTFNVISPHNSETINLYADGPCGSSRLSTRQLYIEFTDCTCPVGFQPLASNTRCECDCDSKLFPYITDCNSTTESLMRVNTNSWITHVNNTDPPGYVIHPNCPFDYCRPLTENVSMNLNLLNGSDAQCAYNRSGILCGACREPLSLSLGSSRCLLCLSYWPAVFTIILVAAIIAGILLVTALLTLNMTVAVGLINGFIFYANILAANSAVFFPSSEPSFPTIFVAWLNLDIGIDVCFFGSLDAYTKTWLQLVFPIYIISLVIVIIIVSEYSPWFARLIGKRDPIATLATLILLSYAKLLSVTITALSFAILEYPDGSRVTVWLPDGNVPYFQGKHVALALVALLIILVGIPYTILLFLWQWLVCTPKWKVFKWTRNTKLNAFISVHHVPYNSKYRYWTGLLLLVRVVLYITASITTSYSNKPQSSLLITVILLGGLFFLNGITGFRAYKNSTINVLETGFYFNLLAFAAFSQYDFKTDITKQTAVAYISAIITFILLVGVIIYHVYLLVRKDQPWQAEEVNEYSLDPVQPAEGKVTHSVVEIPKPCDQPPPLPPPEENTNQIEVREIICTATPVYQ